MERRSARNSRIALAATLVVACALRLGVAEWMVGCGEQMPDGQIYHAYATSMIVRGEYFDGHDRARRAPGYPMFLAGCWLLWGCDVERSPDPRVQSVRDRDRLRAALYGQAIAGTLTCWLAHALAAKLEGFGLPGGTRWFALAFATFDPYAIVLSGLKLSETLFATCLTACALLGVVATVRNRESGASWVAVPLGALIGLTVLVRPGALLLAPLAALFWWWFCRRKVSVTRLVAIASVAAAVTMAPWIVRNALVYGRFVPTALNVGESLYDGWNPDADGSSDMGFSESKKNLPEVERNRHWTREALTWAAANPRRVVELAAIKLARFWSPWPNEPRFRTAGTVIATTIGTVPAWALALVATWAFRRRPGVVTLCWLPTLYFCGLHMVFVSSVRYRAPTMALIAVLAGAGAAIVASRLVGRRESGVVGA